MMKFTKLRTMITVCLLLCLLCSCTVDPPQDSSIDMAVGAGQGADVRAPDEGGEDVRLPDEGGEEQETCTCTSGEGCQDTCTCTPDKEHVQNGCSCPTRRIGLNVDISPLDKNIYQLITTRYSDAQLTEIAAFRGTIHELHEAYPIECLRWSMHANGISVFRIEYLGNEKQVTKQFDDTGDSFGGLWVYNVEKYKADFSGLTVGQTTAEDVKAIDPNGWYSLGITGVRLYQSIHLTKDGYVIEIDYDFNDEDELVIIRIYEAIL